MITLPSNQMAISKVEHYVQHVVRKFNIKEEGYSNILISLTEAVNNAIKHGNKNDESKFVNVHLEKLNKGLSIRVSDQGIGFDPKAIQDPTKEENLECCGGRGVFIIKALCDKVSYHNDGSTVEMFFEI